VERLAARGLTPANTVSLEVAGRRTGRPRRAAVVLARHAGSDYVVSLAGESQDCVVSLAGESQWVRNLRAAGGEAVLRHGDTRRVRLTAVAVADRAPILHAFLQHRALARSPARAARYYFDLPPHPSVGQLAPLAERYPDFAIQDADGPPPA
jgi:hypothetical protein